MVGGGAPVSGWQALDGFVPPMPGAVATASSLVVANVAGDLLAYRNRCAGCGSALDHGDLSGGTLNCPSCARKFELPLAGRCEEEGVQLSPCRCCGTATPCGSRWHDGDPAGPGERPPPAPPGGAAAAGAPAAGADEQCELCTLSLAAKHRHLLHLWLQPSSFRSKTRPRRSRRT